MANLRKQVVVLGFLIFLELPCYASGEETVNGLLSLAILEIKTDIENIKRRIENIEINVQGKSIEINEEEIMDIKENMNMQALAIKKILTAEKLLLGETVENFVSKFDDFESKIQKDIASINASLEGKVKVMIDKIKSSSIASAGDIAKVTADFYNTTSDIRKSLKRVQKTVMSEVRGIEKRLIANITMILEQSATKNTLSSLQTHFDSLDSTVSSISYNQTHFIEPELRSLSSQISSVSTSLSSRISSMESPMPIAFNAFRPRNMSPRDGEIVVFTYANLNAGRGYDTTNGIFTAPARGLYLFSAHFCNSWKRHMVFGIYVGDNNIAGSTVVDEIHSGCGSFTVVTMMDLGQRVSVRSKYDGNELYDSYHRQNSFMGVRIHA